MTRVFTALVLLSITTLFACDEKRSVAPQAQPPTPTPTAPAPVAKAINHPSLPGVLDAANCQRIEGWAVDVAGKGPARVEILDGEAKVLEVEASTYRADLEQAGLGDGKIAFSIETPAALKDGKPHVVRARLGPAGAALNKTIELNCQP